MQCQSLTQFQSGERISLRGDPNCTGTLVNPVAQTYPPTWTVQFDDGQYLAISETSLSRLSSTVDIPFCDPPETSNHRLQQEIALLQQKIVSLEQQNSELQQQLRDAKETIRLAKDISPLTRPSLQRVLRFAHQACLEVVRTAGGWVLKMGKLARKFCRLADIWVLLSQDNWILSEIFAPDKLISVSAIVPPPLRKKSIPPLKETYPLVEPSTVQFWRKIGLPRC